MLKPKPQYLVTRPLWVEIIGKGEKRLKEGEIITLKKRNLYGMLYFETRYGMFSEVESGLREYLEPIE